MNRRLLLPFAFALSILAPVVAQGSAAAAQATKSKAVVPSPPAPAPCTQFFLGGQAPTGGPSGRLICHSFYAISYSTTLRDPVWTSYRQTRAMSEGGDRVGRLKIKFRPQPGLTAAEQGAHGDYVHPPYDRGHLTPADDAEDLPHQSDTFVITNVVPQVLQLNEGLWQYLEASVHRLAETEGEVFIVTGATFAATPPLMHRPRQTGRIAVPDATFKAIYIPSRQIALGFFATNANPTVCTVMSVADLTRLTGVDPFPSLPAAVRATLPSFTLPQGVHHSGGHDQLVPRPDCHPAAH